MNAIINGDGNRFYISNGQIYPRSLYLCTDGVWRSYEEYVEKSHLFYFVTYEAAERVIRGEQDHDFLEELKEVIK